MQDTSDVLQKIKKKKTEKTPDNSYLVFLNVRSLFTSISNSKGIRVVKTFLENFPRRKVATKVITIFLLLILTLNNFVFSFKKYLQIQGSAMRKICAHHMSTSSRTIFRENVWKRLEYKGQLQKISQLSIPFLSHGSLHQKQQTTHEDL